MTPPTPREVLPLVVSLGEVGGHRLDLLSIEVWDTWFDLRFARVTIDASQPPLSRRVPPASAWVVVDDLGAAYEVADAVGRGDREFSNGEARLRPSLAPEARSLTVTVDLGPGTVTGTVDLPR